MNFACDDGSELQNTLISEEQSKKPDYQPIKLDHDLTKIIKKTTELPHCQDQSTDDLVFSKKKDKHRRRQARKRERAAAELTQGSSSTNSNKNPFHHDTSSIDTRYERKNPDGSVSIVHVKKGITKPTHDHSNGKHLKGTNKYYQNKEKELRDQGFTEEEIERRRSTFHRENYNPRPGYHTDNHYQRADREQKFNHRVERDGYNVYHHRDRSRSPTRSRRR